MREKPECSFWNEMNRDKMEEMCCLFALGDLSPEEKLRIEEHMRGCKQCRELVKEFERMMFIDLPAIAVLRSEGEIPEDPIYVNENLLLANIRERASATLERRNNQIELEQPIPASHPFPLWSRSKRMARAIAPSAGWAIAAVLLLVFIPGLSPHKRQSEANTQAGALKQVLPIEVKSLQGRTQVAETQANELKAMLSEAEARERDSQAAYSRLAKEYQNLNDTYSALEEHFKQEEGKLLQQSAELDLTRSNLNEQKSAKDSLQGQLSEVYARLEKQRTEVSRLERVAATVPASFPIAEQTVDGSEAKEILGARDLHIVDVYDVDNSGDSSRAYGRIYYVNHSQLVFYAFDLSKLERNHKVVAFQAWGYRQPKSSNAESLGLFYMDNATLNRWTLRVSDPQILSRIDTLFVTVEPPGGSRFPKGKRLLMASLTGPPNHP